MQAKDNQQNTKQKKSKQPYNFEVRNIELQGKAFRFPLGKGLLFLLFAVLFCTFIILFSSKRSFKEVVIYDSEGKPQLAPKRLEKLKEDTSVVNKCHQYSLFATKNGWYPCYTCDTSFVFLFRGEIWRYGKHCPKDKPRYSDDWLKSMKLKYMTEFKGDLLECTKMEKQKIYTYPLLPENLKRKNPLGHPPGNKNDN